MLLFQGCYNDHVTGALIVSVPISRNALLAFHLKFLKI